MPVEPESDASPDLVHVTHSVVPISLDDTASSVSNKQGYKYNIEEDEIVDNDRCEFSHEELDRPYYSFSPRSRGWQRIRSNLLKSVPSNARPRLLGTHHFSVGLLHLLIQ